jgi:hypothetical protein
MVEDSGGKYKNSLFRRIRRLGGISSIISRIADSFNIETIKQDRRKRKYRRSIINLEKEDQPRKSYFNTAYLRKRYEEIILKK